MHRGVHSGAWRCTVLLGGVHGGVNGGARTFVGPHGGAWCAGVHGSRCTVVCMEVTEVCMEVRGGAQRCPEACTEACTEVCMEVCAEVHGVAQSFTVVM